MRFLSTIFALAVPALAVDSTQIAASVEAVDTLAQWIQKPSRPEFPSDQLSAVPLTRDDAARAAKILWEDRISRLRAERAAELEAKVIRIGDKELKFETVAFGKKENAPSGGRSLFISLHGGGNAPAGLNDDQWRNQVKLAQGYAPTEGLYVAPRGPTNTWNLWHEAHIDPLFDRLIENLVAIENVNPNRVYLMGYSAGGDGVYQVVPRMADRWAAAAMMAGHPNETQPFGLRNVPFAIQVGEKDSGFKRNQVAAEWGAKLDALEKADPEGYKHFTEVHVGKGHWMGLADRKAVPWMEKFTRNPLPSKVCWRQDDVIHTSFYWLAVPKESAKAEQEITAQLRGQTIELSSKDVPAVTVRLNDAMLNLDEPVTIRSGEKVLFQGKVQRNLGVMVKTLSERGDWHLMFSAEVPVKL